MSLGISARSGALGLVLACALTLFAGPWMLLEMGRLQNLWEGRPADPVVCSFRAQTGLPCLGCGGTRALGLAARGRLLAAIAANPLGAWVGLALWGGILVGAGTLATGRCALWPAIATVVTSGALAFLVTVLWWGRQLLTTATPP